MLRVPLVLDHRLGGALMARDHARVNLAIWNDDDWLDLPPAAQHLYFVLWTHPDLSYAGVAPWNPTRIAARATGWTVDDVRAAAACLEARLFIVVDEAMEECLVRSFVRFDGIMKQPIMAVSFTKARAAVGSREIRAVIVHEAQKHHEREPNLAGWGKPQVQELLGQRALDPRDRPLPADPFTPGATPHVTPLLTLSPGVGGNPSPNPSPTPTPTPTTSLRSVPAADADDDAGESKTRRKPERPLPPSWTPTARHHEMALEKRLDIRAQVTSFRNHAETHDRRARDWDAAFRTWLNKAKTTTAPPTNDDWMFR